MIEDRGGATTSVSSRDPHPLGVLDAARTFGKDAALEAVMTAIVDAAIEITHAQQGALLLAKSSGDLEVTAARDAQRVSLPRDQVKISSGVVKRVMGSRSELIVDETDEDSSMARPASNARLESRSVVAIPVKKSPRVKVLGATLPKRRRGLLGVLYLNIRWPFFGLDRKALRRLAREAARVVENAWLFATAREKARLDREVEITGQVQRRLQPARFPRLPELEITGFVTECQAVGGDCLDVVELPGGRHGLFVGDVAGKGIPASLLASLLQGVIGTIGALDLPPEEMASRVNHYLCERSAEGQYATLFYAVLDSAGRFDYVNAGHVPALIRRCSGRVDALESSNFPVGMFSNAKYTRGTAQIKSGDYLLIYTDGIPEARNKRGQFFKETGGLQQLLQEFHGQTVDGLAEAVRSGVQTFTEGAPKSDDISVVAVHYRGQVC
jgi:sigma-B regulation protein RsbU (phosphoserine phosphatase)